MRFESGENKKVENGPHMVERLATHELAEKAQEESSQVEALIDRSRGENNPTKKINMLLEASKKLLAFGRKKEAHAVLKEAEDIYELHAKGINANTDLFIGNIDKGAQIHEKEQRHENNIEMDEKLAEKDAPSSVKKVDPESLFK